MIRVVRMASVMLLVLVSTVVAAGSALAHDSAIVFVVVGDGAGRVRVAATWQADGHLVAEPVNAFIVATRVAGAEPLRVGPAPLVAVPGELGIYEYPERLAPGTWTAVAESAQPILGRGQADLVVGATAVGFPADFPPRPPSAAAGNPVPVWLIWPVLALAVGGLAWVARGRRPRATRRST